MIDSPKLVLLDPLGDILADLPLNHSDEVIQDNLSLIRGIGRPESMALILDQVLNDRRRLGEIAGRSYRHVNHFDKIVLIDSDNELSYRLTLHMWNPPYSETELSDELIHDHRFSFWSTVLTGDLVSENFSRAESGMVFRQYRYIPEVITHNFYEFIGEATLVKTCLSKRSAGESYHLSYESIHRVILPQTDMVCTLVLRGPRQRRYSNVYNTTYPRENTRTANVMFAESEMEIKLRRLLASVTKKLDERRDE